ncbi:MAG: lamin tail domain-containing protein [Planctomycetales bacterium]|nr:lamin tail domain-containing protein [Planctomycetales bacterium]
MLHNGDNVLAVEVHQQSEGSSDVVFGMTVSATTIPDVGSQTNNELLMQHLRITEIMYNPIGGSDLEYIELQNTGTDPINLAGVRISEGIDFTFPTLMLGGGEYILVVNDQNAFRTRYGTGLFLAGEFSGNLSNGGETIRLQLPVPQEANILLFDYDDAWYPTTDGDGFSLVTVDAEGPRSQWTVPEGWRPSNFIGGSPGIDDAGLEDEVIVINEVLANTMDAAGGRIELKNNSRGQLNLEGWYLSDAASDLTKYQLPAGTTIDASGFVVLSEQADFGSAFTLAPNGGQIFLASPDAVGDLAGYVVTITYGATDPEFSVGRHEKSDGTIDVAILSSVTFGADNAAPLVGPIVINEIMYRPLGADEYLELHNITSEVVSLYDPANPSNTWQLAGGVEFDFPTGSEIAANSYALIVGIDPATFRTAYSIPAEIQILGPYSGDLADTGDELFLFRPGTPAGTLVPSIQVDHVAYDDESPWPNLNDSINLAINRVDVGAYGNDPGNWITSIVNGTPGEPNLNVDTTPPTAATNLRGQLQAGPQIVVSWDAASDPETGVDFYRVFRSGVEIGTTTQTTFADTDVTIPGFYRYAVSAVNFQGLAGPRSSATSVRPIAIDDVSSRFPTQVSVRFSDPISQASAEDIANYQIDQGVVVSGAILGADQRTVILTTSQLELDTNYEITVLAIEGSGDGQFLGGQTRTFQFIQSVPGITVRTVYSTGPVTSLAGADAVLSGTVPIDHEDTALFGAINFLDDDGHVASSEFDGDSRFPGDQPGDDDSFVSLGTGVLTIPEGQGGMWTFGANVALPDGSSTEPTTLITLGDTWRYLDDATDQGTAWRNPGFNDSSWAQGTGQLGYGDGDESTIISNGGNPNNVTPTYYFRRTFNIADASQVNSLAGELVRDDGVAIYVNGTEVYRENLRNNAGFNDYADTFINNENAVVPFTFDPAVLVSGPNVIAVEIHQSDSGSSDVSFDLGLSADITGSDLAQDGLRLRLNDQDILVADNPNVTANRFNSVQLAPGSYDFEFLFFENTAGAEVELFAAPGTFENFGQTDTWRLVGDTANGGLSVVTDAPEAEHVAWGRAAPSGSQIYRFEERVPVVGLGAPIEFQTELQAGTIISLLARPDGTNAAPTLSIRDEAGTLATATAGVGDRGVTINGFVVPATGTYVFEVSGSVTGDILLEGLANSYAEEELGAGSQNDTLATAQPLAGGLDAGDGLVQTAVRGITDGFATTLREAGTLFAPNVLTFDFANFPAALADGSLVIEATGDLNGQSEFLTFSAEGMFEQDIFVDGIDDGINRLVIPFTQSELEALAGDGLIRFTITPSSGVDDFSGNGISLSLTIGEPTPDLYAVSFETGQPVSIGLSAGAGAAMSVSLSDSSGNVLAYGVPTATANVIHGFTPDATGIYYVTVTGEAQTPYELIVTRNGFVELVSNESLTAATNVSPYPNILGSVGSTLASQEPPDENRVPISLSQTILDGHNFQWDIQPSGSINNGSIDAYDGGLRLDNFGGGTSAVEEFGREVVIGPAPIFGTDVEITRKIYVSPTNGFARFLEIVTNTGSTSTTYPLQVRTNLGSDGNTNLVGTSSGDSNFTPDDHWIVTDDDDNTNDPVVTHLFGDGKSLGAAQTSFSGDDVSFQFDLSLSPGETKIVMHFASQADTRATALATVLELEQLRLDTLKGISAVELSQLANFRPSDAADFFELSIGAGQTITITTETPAPNVAEVSNDLDPIVQLFDSLGNEVAMDDNSGLDGRNAVLTYQAAEAGEFTLRVAGASGSGEYIARLSGHELDAGALTITDTLPARESDLVQFPSFYTLKFSSGVRVDSVQSSDLTVNGTPAAGVEFLDGQTVRFQLDPTTDVGGGLYSVEIADAAMTSLTGASSSLFQTTFFLDAIPPHVESVTWNGFPLAENQIFGSVPLSVNVQFSEPISEEELDTGDFIIYNTVNFTIYNAQNFSYNAANSRLAAFFPALPEGEYIFRLTSGDEGFEDLVGNDLDGEAIGTNADGTPTGDGVPGGDFLATFTVDKTTPSIDGLFESFGPRGVGAHLATIVDSTGFAGDVDHFAATMDAGEVLSILLESPDPTATWELSVVDSDDIALAQVSSSGPSLELPLATAENAGVYRIGVTSDVVDAEYQLVIARNATMEIRDSSAANPLSITGTDGYAGVHRYVVQGSAQITNPTTLLWAVQPATGEILTLDPTSGVIINRFAAPDNLDATHQNIGLSMAELGDVLLYVNSDVDPTILYRLNPNTGAVLSTETIPDGIHDGLGYQRGGIFLGRDGIDLRRQSGYSGPATDGWGTGSPTGGVGGDDTGRLFIFTASDNAIHEIDWTSDTDSYLSTIPLAVTDIEGLAFDGTLLYASTASGSLLVIDPDVPPDAALVNTVALEGLGLYGLAAASELANRPTGEINSIPGNDSLDSAQPLDGNFSLRFDPNVDDGTVNISEQFPHVTIHGVGDGTYDFYRFNSTRPGSRIFVDIDNTNNLDSYLRLYDSTGAIVRESDDNGSDMGSNTGLDSFVEYVVTRPGTYYVEVGSCCVSPVSDGGTYDLHVTVANQPESRQSAATLVSAGSVWKYLDDGSNQGDAWRAPTFDDSTWSAGPAQLGYGDGDENTRVRFGGDTQNKFITTYFRREFNVSDASQYTELTLQLLRDDGAAVYLNGTEVARDNLVGNAAYDDTADSTIGGANEDAFVTFSIPPSALVNGRNVLAVEIHQESADSSDISFDLQLDAKSTKPLLNFGSIAETDVYEVDLTAGNASDITLHADAANFAGATLELLSPAGEVVASATPPAGTTAADLAILGYIPATTGPYHVRLISEITGEYTLVVTDGYRMDLEPNNAPANPLLSLNDTHGAFGHLVAARGDVAYSDPAGDALGTTGSIPDITEVTASIDNGELLLSMTFAEPINNNDQFGMYYDLDLDQNAATGDASLQSQFASAGQQGGPLGTELRVLAGSNAITGGQATIYNLDFQVVGNVPQIVEGNTIEVRIPTSMLNDSEAINVGSVMFVGNSFADAAPDTRALMAVDGSSPDTATDPTGDSIDPPPVPDIADVQASMVNNTFDLRISLHDPFTNATPYTGYVELDIDQNSATGDFSYTNSGLGVDRRIYFGTQAATGFDEVIVYRGDFSFVDFADLTVTSTGFRMQVPLSLLGGNTPKDFTLFLGNSVNFLSDVAPNEGWLTVEPTPTEPAIDQYLLTLAAGETVDLSTTTPLLPSGNLLDPAIAVIAPDASRMTDTNSSPDGRNAHLIFTAPEAGDYIIEVASEGAAGNYQLHVADAVEPVAVVVGKSLVYNNSSFDDEASGGEDHAALATNKQPLLPGGVATFANYSSYSRGINGLAIDIAGLAGTPSLTDFTFRVGNDNDPANWPAAPDPVSIEVAPGRGLNGSDRVLILWNDNAIEKEWLQVTVVGTAATGLAAPDVFYYGNAVGESGDSSEHAKVDTTDEVGARNNPRTFLSPADIEDPFDFNRDRRVDTTDQIIARNNLTSFLTELQLIDLSNGQQSVAGPGDFNEDGRIDRHDVNALNHALVSGEGGPLFDVDEDGFVDYGDLTTLVVDVLGTTPGDVNLDGRTDGGDYSIWHANVFEQTTEYSRGDLNADGVVDVSDFNIWFSHRFSQGQVVRAAESTLRTPRSAEPISGVMIVNPHVTTSTTTRPTDKAIEQMFVRAESAHMSLRETQNINPSFSRPTRPELLRQWSRAMVEEQPKSAEDETSIDEFFARS